MNPFTTPGAVSWTGLQTSDTAAAQDFYAAVFGWTLEQAQIPGMPPYTMIKVGEAAIGGIAQAQPGQPTAWQSYVTVADLDACLGAVERLGGRVLQPPMDVPTVGRIAVIADPQGAVLAPIEYLAAPPVAVKLYYFAPSHHSRRVLAVIRHLGIEVALDHRDLTKGEHRRPDLAALNPTGLLPVLQAGDFVLSESNAIMQYLADRFGPTALYPAEPAARARVNQWLSWQMCHFGPATAVYVYENVVKRLVGQGSPDPERLAKAVGDVAKHGAVLDAHLAKQAYVAGEHVTLADFALASNLMYAEPAQIPWQDWTHVRAWYARVAALPAWQSSEPPR